jgi:plasmid stability protein
MSEQIVVSPADASPEHLGILLPPTLKAALAAQAAANERSLSSEVRWILRQHLAPAATA